jgi:hypothetical protein
MAEPLDIRVKRILLGLAIGVVITIGTLVMMEGTASDLLFVRDYRAASASKALIRPHTMNDTLLGWTNRPSFSSPDEYGKGIPLSTTPEGFRARGAGDAVSARPTRIVCSGDSYTLGYGVSDDHTWCALLARNSADVETFNMGEIDYGLDQDYLAYRRDGGRASPQIEVLGLTNGALERLVTANYGGRIKPTLALEGDRLVTKDVPVRAQTPDALRRAAKARTKDELRIVQLVRKIPGMDDRAKDARRIDAQWPLVEKILDELTAENKKRGSRLVVAYLPTKRDMKPSYVDARRRRLEEYCRRHGTTFVDLTPAMRALRKDSLDLAFISRVPRGAAPGVANQYSNLGNLWVARMLSSQLSARTMADSR